MIGINRWSRLLIIVGLVASIIGVVDPLEGSLIILAGIGMIALGTFLGKCPQRKLLFLSFVFVLVGAAALWGLSAVGGIGGNSGRSYWWGLTLLPYPVGWIMGLAGAFRCLRKVSSISSPSSQDVSVQ